MAYDAFTQLPTGARLTVVDGPVMADGYTWYRTAGADGPGVGWAAGEFLTWAGSGGFWVDDQLVVVDGPLNRREGPGLAYEIVDQLQTNERVTVVDGPRVANAYIWYKVASDDGSGSGWVAGEFLAPR